MNLFKKFKNKFYITLQDLVLIYNYYYLID
jgi:hypothetical protein